MMAGKGLTLGVADYQVLKSAITASDISSPFLFAVLDKPLLLLIFFRLCYSELSDYKKHRYLLAELLLPLQVLR